MSTPKPSTRRLAVAAVVLPLIVFGIIAGLSVKKSRSDAAQAYNSPEAIKVRQTLTNWNTGNFKAINDRAALESELFKKLESVEDLTALEKKQKDALLNAVRNFLIAYHSPDPADYFAFRLPSLARSETNYHPHQGEIERYKRYLPSIDVVNAELKKAGNSSSAAELGYDLSKPLLVIEKYRELIDTASRQTPGGGIPCATCFSGVNLDTLSVKSGVVTNAEALTLGTLLASAESIGRVQPLPDLSFKPSPQELIKKNGSVRYASVLATIKAERFGNPAIPVGVLWYWVPALETWLPEEVVLLAKLNGADIMF